jgi:Mn2+/Fe2+ NRAMP family transporter
MQTAFDFIMHALSSLPDWLAAILIGWAFSAGVTQALKFLTPLSVYHGYREQVTRVIAMLTASIPAGMVYGVLGGKPPEAVLWVAIGAGLWSPLAFAILQAVLKRYAPWLADVLSQDVRGQTDSRP